MTWERRGRGECLAKEVGWRKGKGRGRKGQRGREERERERENERAGLTILHIHPSQRKVDDRRVLLLYKVVLGEPFGVQDQVRRQTSDLMSFERVSELLRTRGTTRVSLGISSTRNGAEDGGKKKKKTNLRRRSIVLGEDGGKSDLRDDVLFDRVLEQRRSRKVESEEEERGADGFDVCKKVRRGSGGARRGKNESGKEEKRKKRTSTDIELRTMVSSRISLDDDLLSLHLEVTLEGLVDDA